jgi:6-phosphogluconolactonase
VVFVNAAELARGAADLFLKLAQTAVQTRGIFYVALSGGSTPKAVYELLVTPPYRNSVPWESIQFFFGDERCVPPTDSLSNYKMAMDFLFSKVPVNAAQIHPMYEGGDADRASGNYQSRLEAVFAHRTTRFDLVFLGLGPDGHTASLFPHSPALAETKRWVCPGQRAGDTYGRITLTASLINESEVVAFLVAGKDKAEVMKTLFETDADPTLFPAKLIRPKSQRLLWLTDENAVSLLQRKNI